MFKKEKSRVGAWRKFSHEIYLENIVYQTVVCFIIRMLQDIRVYVRISGCRNRKWLFSPGAVNAVNAVNSATETLDKSIVKSGHGEIFEYSRDIPRSI